MAALSLASHVLAQPCPEVPLEPQPPPCPNSDLPFRVLKKHLPNPHGGTTFSGLLATLARLPLVQGKETTNKTANK